MKEKGILGHLSKERSPLLGERLDLLLYILTFVLLIGCPLIILKFGITPGLVMLSAIVPISILRVLSDFHQNYLQSISVSVALVGTILFYLGVTEDISWIFPGLFLLLAGAYGLLRMNQMATTSKNSSNSPDDLPDENLERSDLPEGSDRPKRLWLKFSAGAVLALSLLFTMGMDPALLGITATISVSAIALLFFLEKKFDQAS